MTVQKIDQAFLIKCLGHLWGESRQCPMCGGINWGVGDRVYQLKEFRSPGLSYEEYQYIPIVPVACQKCGNTVMVNYKTLLANAMDWEGGK